MSTIFEQVLAGKIPCKPVYEDDWVLVIEDILPVAPVHLLFLPKTKAISALDLTAESMGKILEAVQLVARQLNLTEKGFRLVTNVGSDGGQTVPYFHLHLLAGRPLSWPPG